MESIKEKVHRVFDILASAEGEVHSMEKLAGHFHEVGATDAMIDVIGTVTGVEILGSETVISSSLALGSGTVKTAHGVLPLPAPATVAILKGCPVFQTGANGELTTPTGAALVKGLAGGFGPLPPSIIQKTGYGAGAREVPGRANMLRLMLCRIDGPRGADRVTVLETNIDDMTPLAYEKLFTDLFDAGALDVFTEGITMKRGRPGVKLSIISPPALENKLAAITLRGSTTFGVRCHTVWRWIKDRKIIKVETRYGKVRVKLGILDGKVVDHSPEYIDCRRLADKAGVGFLEVYEKAKESARAATRGRR